MSLRNKKKGSFDIIGNAEDIENEELEKKLRKLRQKYRTFFKIFTVTNDEYFVKKKIFSWVSENKGKVITEKSDGTKIKIALLSYIHPLKNYLVVKFFKTNNIIFELKTMQEGDVIVIEGEGYITNGLVEIDFDQTKVWGFVPRRKGYELLENLKSRFVG